MPDIDFFILIYLVIATVIGGIRRLRANVQWIPKHYDFIEIGAGSLSESQKDFLERHDARFASMNYVPVATYRAANYGHNLLRSYICAGNKARAIVMVIEITVKAGEKDVRSHHCMIEFLTRFPNGQSLTTRNMKVKTVLDSPPEIMIQECPTIDDPAKLKALHDKRASEMGEAKWPASSFQAILAEVQVSHEKLSQYRLLKGQYRFDEAKDSYAPTDKVFWRGIRNYFNPFAQRVPSTKLSAAIAVGALLPIFAVLGAGPKAAELLSHHGHTMLPVSTVVVLGLYILAGALIGHILGKGVLWGFVLTYVPVHLAAGWVGAMVPFSTIAGYSAFLMTQANARKKLILLSSQ